MILPRAETETITMSIPDRTTFENIYAGQPHGDIGKRRKHSSTWPTRSRAASLDPGCGTGENALFFAGRGCTVTGIDFLEEPIRRARRKATEWGLPVTFLAKGS